MKKLKLPVIKEIVPKAKILSMDDYFIFIQFNLKQAFDRRAYTKWKKMLVVDVPFFL